MRRRWQKLRWQLMFSYLPLIFVPVLLVGFVTRGAAEQGYSLLVTQGAQEQAHSLSECFVSYYESHRSWVGLSNLLNSSTAKSFTWEFRPSQTNIASTDNTLAMIFPPPRGPGFGLNMRCRLESVPAASANSSTVQIQPQAIWGASALANLGAAVNVAQAQGSQPNDVPPPNNPSDPPPNQGPPPRDMRDFLPLGDMLIADLKGVVVASNRLSNVGQTLSPATLEHGEPIITNNKTVGTLVIGTALGVIDQQQSQLLDTVNLGLLFSGALSALLAVGLGWALSGQITTPMKQLMAGVKRLSSGEWSAPLEIRSNNEFGELTYAFNTMASELIHQQQMNRQMVADIAHDLRTPLSTMALEVEAIEAGFQTPEEATVSLREEITFLQRLVDDLRLLSLMDAHQIHLQQEIRPLYPFLCSVLDFWQILATEGNRSLALENTADSLPDVCIDPARMRQVLGNLIDNAIRHTKSGGKIILSAQADSTHIILRVADNGEGISPDDLPHIFDRFYRTDPSRTHNSNGSGLGLSISRRLVELHGGTIDVQSILGQGTTFTIRLPYK